MLLGSSLKGLEEQYKELRSNQDLYEGTKKENSEVETVIIYDHMIQDSEVEWPQGCAIGRFRDGMNVKKAQDLLEAEDISCQMCVMEGTTILLKFDSKERMEGTLSSFNETFDSCFEDLRPWSQASLQREVAVRISLEEVPLHLWNEQFFRSLGDNKLNIPPLTIKGGGNVYKVIVPMVDQALQSNSNGVERHDATDIGNNGRINALSSCVDSQYDSFIRDSLEPCEDNIGVAAKVKRHEASTCHVEVESRKNEVSDQSISDEDIENRNALILKEAELDWEMSSTLGLVFVKSRPQMTEIFANLEMEDRLEKEKRG
ncbi:hypothetical protein DITRI_Ditri09bG0105200 [Diplodiscus trichospermus]